MGLPDYYNTIEKSTEGYFKDRGSRFIALVYHVTTEQEAKDKLLEVKKKYYNARHHCYAFRINPEDEFQRSNDDGEPSGTAGKPILNLILSYELFDITIIVIRYFGGIKLGISGLIKAYKTATKEALDRAVVIQKTITRQISLHFDYSLMNIVMRKIKEENLKILSKTFEISCNMLIEVEKSRYVSLIKMFSDIYGLTTK